MASAAADVDLNLRPLLPSTSPPFWTSFYKFRQAHAHVVQEAALRVVLRY